MHLPETLPPTRSGAAHMLRSAYPGGMPATANFAVLALLYEHFSDRHLADLMAHATGKDAARVLNDMHACAGSQPDDAAIGAVRERLDRHGWQAICAED